MNHAGRDRRQKGRTKKRGKVKEPQEEGGISDNSLSLAKQDEVKKGAGAAKEKG